MEFGKEEYDLKYFYENNFIRKQCKSCKRFFWTLNKDFEYCQSAPCVTYNFLGNKIMEADTNFVRKEFINFFKGKGHTEISPRPVLARWREDIFLTIASIAVFQPFVTKGITNPPANPLVISQPCIRLKDIDLVGKTAGRHLTIFEMMAHHAFNTKEKIIYWKDETVEYCQEFSASRMKIDPYSICYIEDSWMGGGDAGPCFEVATNGLEIATLVFMKYEIDENKLKDLPLFIVDTGYGLERYVWYLSGKPSAFHAIYGDLAEKVLNKARISSDLKDLLFIHSSKSLFYLENKDPTHEISREVGINEIETKELIKRIEGSYAILDHSKCVLFMLADGLVPSNMGEGYLGRLVIRKLLKTLKSLNIDLTLEELFKEQIKLWGRIFPRLVENKERIFEVIELESEKYEQLLRKADIMLENMIKEKINKKEKFNIDELIELYDSHGISPEFVEEKAAKYNISITVPQDFLTRIVEKHEATMPKVSQKAEIPNVPNIPATYPIYYENPYLSTFEAKVIKAIEPSWIILDKTAFYPEGGGQIYDTGKIYYKNKVLEVVEVYKSGNVILHKVKGNLEDVEGKEIVGEVNFERRINIMRHHTATHIILYSLRKILGNHVWQAGSHKDEEKGRLDITHYRRISDEELKLIEKEANRLVLMNIPVTAKFMDRREAEEKYGFGLYQGGVYEGGIIRVVSIGDYDHQACGGTHVKSTGEVGLIKIIKAERIQDGIERIVYTAGIKTLEYIENNEDLLKSISTTLNAPLNKILEGINKVVTENKLLKKEMERLRKSLATEIYENIKDNPVYSKEVKFYFIDSQNLSEEDIISLGEIFRKESKDSVLLVYSQKKDQTFVMIFAGDDAINKGIRANEIAKNIINVTEGKGGGDNKFSRVYLSSKFESDKVIKETINYLNSKLT